MSQERLKSSEEKIVYSSNIVKEEDNTKISVIKVIGNGKLSFPRYIWNLTELNELFSDENIPIENYADWYWNMVVTFLVNWDKQSILLSIETYFSRLSLKHKSGCSSILSEESNLYKRVKFLLNWVY